MQASTGTQAVDRAAALVRLVVQSPAPVPAVDLAASAGLPKSTTSRLLSAMERNHLLARTADGAWVAGPLFASYASGPNVDSDLIRLAHPTLLSISELTGEAVHLAVARGDQVEQVDQVDATYLLGSRNWVGVPVPPHVSALGKALYAGGALPLPTGSLETPTSVSIGTAEELRRHLASVRTAGYAVTVDELEVGLTGVAAPVTRGSVVVAAVGISGPTSRLQPTLEATGRIITQHARALSARLSRTIKEGAA